MAKKNSRGRVTAEDLAYERELRSAGIQSTSLSGGGLKGAGRASITRKRAAGHSNKKIFGGG